MTNLIEKTLLEHILDRNAVFVFPTQTSAELWADRIIETTEIQAVPMEKFIAWDKFKGQSIKAKKQDKKSIPSQMRLFFASQIIEDNKNEHFLKNIILPEHAGTSNNFLDFIAGLLPGLALWKSYFDKNSNIADEEDEDLSVLYTKYSEFLNKYNLFDPAWEYPPFEADGNHYYIFFPEILSDYAEYEKILEKSDDITQINISEEMLSNIEPVYFYSNARSELKAVALQLRDYHDKNNISWADIAINVPDLDNYGPYLQRELDLYEIPFVLKYARPLSSYGAGSLFSQIKNCISSKYNYSSLLDLLLNTDIPWKNELKKSKDDFSTTPELITDLIQFGKKNHCICSYDYNDKYYDVWEESFKGYSDEERLRNFYKSLKTVMNSFDSADCFEKVRDAYFNFRQKFLDMSKCTEKADKILSRCITELGYLINLEQEYDEIKIKNPFEFFVNYISGVNYLQQTEDQGVQIFPYRTAAAAPFKVQLVVDSSQTGLSVIYKELGFLREDKRYRILKREDTNVSEAFVKLYSMNSMESKVFFTASSRTLTGYSQSCSYLKEEDLTNCSNDQLLKNDFLKQEKEWYLENEKALPNKITAVEKRSIENWLKNQKSSNYQSLVSIERVVSQLKEKGLNISNSMLRSFYECPRKWYLENRLGLLRVDNAATLMDSYAFGNLYHKVYELYCKSLHKKNMVVHTTPQGLTDEYKEMLNKALEDAINDVGEPLDKRKSFLSKELLRTTEEGLREILVNSVTKFSQVFEGCYVVDNEGWLNYQDPEKEYKCNGRIDCLLQNEDSGQYYLVDFKTSENQIKKLQFFAEKVSAEEEIPLEEQKLPDFQMPMYVYLFENGSKKCTIENVCFFDITKGNCYMVYGEELSTKLPKPPKVIHTRSDFDYTLNTLVKCMDNLNERVCRGDFSLNPKIQNFSVCSKCDHKAICRKTFNVGRKD